MVLENTSRRKRRPTVGAFLCPFPKVKISLGCVLGYNCILMPGVPDMSKASAQRRGAAPLAVFNTRHFLLEKMPVRTLKSSRGVHHVTGSLLPISRV